MTTKLLNSCKELKLRLQVAAASDAAASAAAGKLIVDHTVTFLCGLCKVDGPRRWRAMWHYAQRASKLVPAREAIASSLLAQLVADRQIEAAILFADALSVPGRRAVDIAVEALDRRMAWKRSLRDYGTSYSGHNATEYDSVSSDCDDGAHQIKAQITRAMSRDDTGNLARQLVAAAVPRLQQRQWQNILWRCAVTLRGKRRPISTELSACLRKFCRPIDWAERRKRDAATRNAVMVVNRAIEGIGTAFAFGSTVTCLDIEDVRPDVDVVVITNHVLLKPSASCSVSELRSIARKLATDENVSKIQVIDRARIPTIRFTLCCCYAECEGDRGATVDVDIAVNNLAVRELGPQLDLFVTTQAVCNTAVLRFLATHCRQFPELSAVARRFSRAKGICGARRRNLSSYAWTILCLRALQNREHLPALDLPASRSFTSVSRNDGTVFNPEAWVAAARSGVCAELAAICGKGHKESAGQPHDALGVNFVELLRLVAFGKADVISLRGSSSSQFIRPTARQRNHIRLEDPIELEHDLGTTLTSASAARLRCAALLALIEIEASSTPRALDEAIASIFRQYPD